MPTTGAKGGVHHRCSTDVNWMDTYLASAAETRFCGDAADVQPVQILKSRSQGMEDDSESREQQCCKSAPSHAHTYIASN